MPETVAKPKTPVHKFSFTGGFGEVFFLTLKNTLFTIFTLGLYLPYARTNMRKYIWKSSKLAKHPFLFHADPKNLLKGYLILGGLFIAVSMTIGTLSKSYPDYAPALKILFSWIIIAVVLRARFAAYAYVVNNTSYRSIRFNVNKDGMKEYMSAVIGGYFLTVLSLGLYFPFAQANLTKIKWKHTKFGNVPFRFLLKNSDYAVQFYKNVFFCLITFGLYIPWAIVSLHNFKMKHLRFQSGSFISKATGFSLIGLQLKSMLLLIFSLGLAFPYVNNMKIAYYLGHLRLKGNLDFEAIIQEAKGSDNGIEDSIADVFDVDVDVA